MASALMFKKQRPFQLRNRNLKVWALWPLKLFRAKRSWLSSNIQIRRVRNRTWHINITRTCLTSWGTPGRNWRRIVILIGQILNLGKTTKHPHIHSFWSTVPTLYLTFNKLPFHNVSTKVLDLMKHLNKWCCLSISGFNTTTTGTLFQRICNTKWNQWRTILMWNHWLKFMFRIVLKSLVRIGLKSFGSNRSHIKRSISTRSSLQDMVASKEKHPTNIRKRMQRRRMNKSLFTSHFLPRRSHLNPWNLRRASTCRHLSLLSILSTQDSVCASNLLSRLHSVWHDSALCSLLCRFNRTNTTQIHRNRTLGLFVHAFTFTNQTNLQPPSPFKHLEWKTTVSWLMYQSSLPCTSKDGLPSDFMQRIATNHVQINASYNNFLHGDWNFSYGEFQIYHTYCRKEVITCTSQDWSWPWIPEFHFVVLQPLLRNNMASSTWIYEPLSLSIS